MDVQLAHQIRNDPTFIELERTRSRFAWSLTILMLAIYYAFILVVAFAPGVMAIPVGGSITLGFPLGLGVILSAIVLTGLYVHRANGQFDEMTRRVVKTVSTQEIAR